MRSSISSKLFFCKVRGILRSRVLRVLRNLIQEQNLTALIHIPYMQRPVHTPLRTRSTRTSCARGCNNGPIFFFRPIYHLRPSFSSLPPSRNSDPGSQSRPFSPPHHYGKCLAFLSRQDFSCFFPRRLASIKIEASVGCVAAVQQWSKNKQKTEMGVFHSLGWLWLSGTRPRDHLPYHATLDPQSTGHGARLGPKNCV